MAAQHDPFTNFLQNILGQQCKEIYTGLEQTVGHNLFSKIQIYFWVN